MRIERLEIVPYALPFAQPYVTARGRLERRELLLVRLWTDEGAVGLGEAAPLALRGGPTPTAIAVELAGDCRTLVEGNPVGWGRRTALIADCRRAGVPLQALAAVDIALLDLVGKATGEPAWRLLRAEKNRPVRCNATLPAGDPVEIAERATQWAARGFDTFKLKVGVEREIEQVMRVREAVGPHARIRVDANAAWSLDEAASRLAEMARFGLELAEQPVASLEEMASLRDRVEVALAADESVVTVDDAGRAAALAACDAVTVKLAKVGGVEAALAMLGILPLDMSVYLSSALDGPVGIAAAAHLAQALPESSLGASLAHGLATAELFDGTIASHECELRDAALHPGEAPGLGVEIDELELERHRIELG